MSRPVGSRTVESLAILDRGLEIVEGLPYKTSLRNIFYKLLQEGYFPKTGKEGYTSFTKLISSARKRCEKGWAPDTLEDDTRRVYFRGRGFPTIPEAIEYFCKYVRLSYSHFQKQEYYVELWFEAQAMHGQFSHYTKGLTLRPFRGDYTIEPKWNAAQSLARASEVYGKPVVILYFGDLDTKGKEIPYNAARDIVKWCPVEFEFIHVGLNDEQVYQYDVPENPEKPGEYQWEGLDDEPAAEIITGATGTLYRFRFSG